MLKILLRHSPSTVGIIRNPVTGAHTISLISARAVCDSLFQHVRRDLLNNIRPSDSLPYAIIIQ